MISFSKKLLLFIATNFFFFSINLSSNANITEKNKYLKNALEKVKDRISEAMFKYREKIFLKKILKQMPVSWDYYYTQVITHFDVSLTILLDKGMFDAQGDLKARILSQTTENLVLVFEGDILEISMDDNPLTFETQDLYGYKIVEIKLPQAYKKDDILTIHFHSQGKPDCNSNFILNIKVCKFSPNLTYSGASSVLPFSLAGDFATYNLNLIIPKGYVVASTGTVVDITPKGEGSEIHHIVQDFPTGAHAFGFSAYKESDSKYGEKPVKIFYSADKSIEPIAESILKDIGDILKFYSERFGDYLYPKLDIIQIDDKAGAAFGWPMLLWIPASAFVTDDMQRSALFAHEIAHQWWGDLLMNGDNEAPWLSEGFAEYSSLAFMKNVIDENYEKGVYYSYSMLYQYYVKPSNDFPLSKINYEKLFDPYVYVIVTYYKGAIVASMLEKVIGEKNFLQGINSLYGDYAGKEKYYVTETLKKYLENSYGSSLEWFFQKWVYDIGYPIYRAGLRRTEKDGKNYALIDIENFPSAGNKPFVMPIDLKVITPSSEEDFNVLIDEKEKSFEFEVKDYPVRVKIDPENKFIHRIEGKIMGDIDISGDVDGIDLIYVSWAQGGGIFHSQNFLPQADLNFDMVVDQSDLDIVKNNFGQEYE